MQIGMIGLGKMGGNMALKLLEDGHKVVVWNRSESTISNFKFQISNSQLEKLTIVKTIRELVKSLENPRVVWLMLPAGSATQTILDEVAQFIEEGDIVIDGSNAFWKDTEKRYKEFKNLGIRFLGVGVAGGIIGPKEGYAIMAGGDKSAYGYITPILDTLVQPKASHGYFGEGGVGHFVKMLHNGIEYGYMQSLGEGFDVLKHSSYKIDLLKAAQIWQKSSLISGFMMDRAVEILEKDPYLNDIVGVVNASGEAQWTIDAAKEEGVSVEIIERSLEYRKRSQTDSTVQNSFTAKMVAAIRHAFGGHEVKKKE